jgi:hypothetical protein
LWRNWWNEDCQGKLKYSEKICPSATLSITNLTCFDPGLNPGSRSGKPATNRLSYGAANTAVTTAIILSDTQANNVIPFHCSISGHRGHKGRSATVYFHGFLVSAGE